MSDQLLRSLFPVKWYWTPVESFYSEIILNWLDIEIDANAETKFPMLIKTYGHRRREVVNYFDDTKDRRDAEITLAIYGWSGACI